MTWVGKWVAGTWLPRLGRCRALHWGRGRSRSLDWVGPSQTWRGKKRACHVTHTHTQTHTHIDTHTHAVKAGRSLGLVSWHKVWSSGYELEVASWHSRLFQTFYSSPQCVLSFQYLDHPEQVTAATWVLKSPGSVMLLPTSMTLHKWPVLSGPQSPHLSNGITVPSSQSCGGDT